MLSTIATSDFVCLSSNNNHEISKSFRHSSRHAMWLCRRHDQRHVADMSLTRHAMSANEGMRRHDRLRHSLLRCLLNTTILLSGFLLLLLPIFDLCPKNTLNCWFFQSPCVHIKPLKLHIKIDIIITKHCIIPRCIQLLKPITHDLRLLYLR